MHTTLVLLFVASLAACSAQTQLPSPYVGLEVRDIKALSPSEIADLLAGKGMGFAKSAELNEYPGPAHVLELQSQLRMSAEQITQTKAIFSRMETSAKAHGAELVEAERELEALFRSRQVTSEELSVALERIASRQAKVRYSHLSAHIEQTQLLTPEQTALYVALRGYGGQHEQHGGHK
jgi:Spy/CpxP family protein refolding chaperone